MTPVCDHCRIGSLEKKHQEAGEFFYDHCRIGSLETCNIRAARKVRRSLPHRQLRKSVRTVHSEEL